MMIRDMFADDINRKINGVIKVDQAADDVIEQELNEYLEYFNSDARIDLYLLYDKTERDYIYLTDIQTDNPVIYKINISKISGNISSINHNDIVKVTCNGAYTRDFELVKVYSILKVKM